MCNQLFLQFTTKWFQTYTHLIKIWYACNFLMMIIKCLQKWWLFEHFFNNIFSRRYLFCVINSSYNLQPNDIKHNTFVRIETYWRYACNFLIMIIDNINFERNYAYLNLAIFQCNFHHDIAKILLEVALNTNNLNQCNQFPSQFPMQILKTLQNVCIHN